MTKVEYYKIQEPLCKIVYSIANSKMFFMLETTELAIVQRNLKKNAMPWTSVFFFFFFLSYICSLSDFYSVFIIYIFRPQKVEREKWNRCKNGCCKNHRHAQNSSKNMFCKMNVILLCSCTLFFELSHCSHTWFIVRVERIRRQKAAATTQKRCIDIKSYFQYKFFFRSKMNEANKSNFFMTVVVI